MRRFFISALIAAGLTFIGVSSFAETEQPTNPEMEQPTNPEMEQHMKQDTKQGADTQEEYVVKEGDTLSGIAKEVLGSEGEWRAIAELNDIRNPDIILVGQRLLLPSTPDGKVESEPTEGTEGAPPAESAPEGEPEGAPEPEGEY